METWPRPGSRSSSSSSSPVSLTQEGVKGLGGTLHLHATDRPAEWWIDLDTQGSAIPEQATADIAVRGNRSDLFAPGRPTAAPWT